LSGYASETVTERVAPEVGRIAGAASVMVASRSGFFLLVISIKFLNTEYTSGGHSLPGMGGHCQDGVNRKMNWKELL
jgi:hypothetical protein